MVFDYYRDEDKTLLSVFDSITLAPSCDFTRPDSYCKLQNAETYVVSYPKEGYKFLHEAAIIEFEGRLFASWYNCPETELKGRTPIRESRSSDGGVTWSEPVIIADDPSGRILFCPPVYGICDGKLYMLINEMVAPDHIHALDLYVLDRESDRFVMLWSRPIPFKLNTNVVALDNGKLMLPGRIAELDSFPNTPALLISDSGKIDAEWRLVKIAENGDLPDGSMLVHPELTAITSANRVYMFSRDDQRRIPLLYISEDFGETWSAPISHDLPLSDSKIYAGTLSDGRNYLTANLFPGRSKLAIFFTEPGSVEFTKAYLLQDGLNEKLGYGFMWHYPVAYEASGKLYIIYTVSIEGSGRGAVLSVIDLSIN